MLCVADILSPFVDMQKKEGGEIFSLYLPFILAVHRLVFDDDAEWDEMSSKYFITYSPLSNNMQKKLY